MSDEQEAAATADRNFRSAYYKSLGFKESDKSVSHLELLLKAEVYDVKKLKAFCLKHTLTVYYRPQVWKIILSVVPVFTDKDTCSFVLEQKQTEFHDLKHALHVMGRLEHSTDLPSKCQPSTLLTSKHPFSSNQSTHTSSSSSPSLPTHQDHFSATHLEIKSPQTLIPSLAGHVMTESFEEHKPLSQASMSPPCTPRDFVTIYLLENNRLLSASVNQMKQERQVNMMAVAETFFSLFEEESEDSLYWMFSNFLKKLESQLVVMEELLQGFDEILEDVDCTLFEHIKDLQDDVVPMHRWFSQCFAKQLPEACIESIWDRVIGGSCMILVYLAVSILLSFKRKILGLSSAEKLRDLLHNIPKDTFGPIVSKAIELWDSHGSPLSPSSSGSKVDSSSLHELYEIEDYS